MICIWIFTLAISSSFPQRINQIMHELELEQAPNGGFYSVNCSEYTLQHCEKETTPLVTAFVVDEILDLPKYIQKKYGSMLFKAVNYLKQTEEPASVWRYWPPPHAYAQRVRPDIDDTASVRQVLLRLEKKAPVFQDDIFDALEYKHHAYGTWIGLGIKNNPIDIGANSNLLYYFWRKQRRKPHLEQHITNIMNKNALNENLEFYLSPAFSLYSLSKACRLNLNSNLCHQVAKNLENFNKHHSKNNLVHLLLMASMVHGHKQQNESVLKSLLPNTSSNKKIDAFYKGPEDCLYDCRYFGSYAFQLALLAKITFFMSNHKT